MNKIDNRLLSVPDLQPTIHSQARHIESHLRTKPKRRPQTQRLHYRSKHSWRDALASHGEIYSRLYRSSLAKTPVRGSSRDARITAVLAITLCGDNAVRKPGTELTHRCTFSTPALYFVSFERYYWTRKAPACLLTLRGVVSGTTVQALVLGRFGQKMEKNRFERYGQKRIKI